MDSKTSFIIPCLPYQDKINSNNQERKQDIMRYTIPSIQKQVVSCTKCDLCKTRNRSVPGKGNPNSNVIFIGEAPGKNEDINGEPFIGTAGKRLDLALEHAGLSRKDIYITNIVKCRPPKNRVPNQDEKDACRNYLQLEIKTIQPKVICIMGNTAYGTILGGNNITKNRGKIIKKDGMEYFLTIHPAATIYNQGLIKMLKRDIRKLAKYIKET